MRRNTFIVMALAAAASCGERTPTSRVRLDVSALYERQGLGVVASTRVDFPFLGLGLLPRETGIADPGLGAFVPDGLVRDSVDFRELVREVQPDPSTLEISVDVPAAGLRDLLLIGGVAPSGPGDPGRLDYVGYVPDVELVAGRTADVVVPFYPAGQLHLRAVLSPAARLAFKLGSEAVMMCEVLVAGTNARDGTPLTRRTRVGVDGFRAVATQALELVFGVGNLPLPEGDYTVSGPIDCGKLGQFPLPTGDLTVRVAQSSVSTLDLVLDPKLPGGDPGPSPMAFRVRSLSHVQGAQAEKTNLANADVPSLRIEAISVDGSPRTDFVGTARLDLGTFTGSEVLFPGDDGFVAPTVQLEGQSFTGVEVAFTAADQGVRDIGTLTAYSAAAPVMLPLVAKVQNLQNGHERGYFAFTLTDDDLPCTLGLPSILSPKVVAHLEARTLPHGQSGALNQHLFAFLANASTLSPGVLCVQDESPLALNPLWDLGVAFQRIAGQDMVELVSGVGFFTRKADFDGDGLALFTANIGPLLANQGQRVFFNAARAAPAASQQALPLTLSMHAYFLDATTPSANRSTSTTSVTITAVPNGTVPARGKQ